VASEERGAKGDEGLGALIRLKKAEAGEEREANGLIDTPELVRRPASTEQGSKTKNL
jgi:hypothetical protein